MSFKRNKPPETPNLPPMPAPVEILDTIDEISGFETVTITGQDGKKRRVTRALPKTPEEQRVLSMAENLINQSMTNISQLYQYDPSLVVDYQPFIQTFSDINDERVRQLSTITNFGNIAERVQQFREINGNLARREFDRQARISDESLSRRGLTNSTVGAQERASRAAQSALLEQQIDANALNYGEQLAENELSRRAKLYDIEEQGRIARLQQAESSYSLAKTRQQELEQARQNALNENQALLELGRGITKGDDQNTARLALASGQNANQLFSTQAADQMNRYNANVNRILGQHKMDMDRFNSAPKTFGQKLTDMGMQAAGSWISRPGGGYDSFIGGNNNSGPINSLKTWYANSQRDRHLDGLRQVGR